MIRYSRPVPLPLPPEVNLISACVFKGVTSSVGGFGGTGDSAVRSRSAPPAIGTIANPAEAVPQKTQKPEPVFRNCHVVPFGGT